MNRFLTSLFFLLTIAEFLIEKLPRRALGFVPPPKIVVTGNRISSNVKIRNEIINSDVQNETISILDGPFDSSMLVGYWGLQPLLIRNAFSNEKAWPSWNDVVRLSCWQSINDVDMIESGESARLIRHVTGESNTFELEFGPFDVDELSDVMCSTKAKKSSTLILNDVDRYVPSLDHWMNCHFHFLPRWRRDDAQISLATPDGGIGPHVDNYDVFLVQTSGERAWFVDVSSKMTVSEERTKLISGIPVSVLNVTQYGDDTIKFIELHLQKGDMLYLPPRVVHWGIGQSSDCMTLSVGARAPSASDLVVQAAEFLQESARSLSAKRYTDHTLPMVEKNGTTESHSLSSSVKESMKALVKDAMDDLLKDDLVWDSIVGKVITEPIRYSDTYPVSFEHQEPQYKKLWGRTSMDVLLRVKQLGTKACLQRVAGVAFASSRVIVQTDSYGDAIIVDRLFVNGDQIDMKNNLYAESLFLRIDQGSAIDGALLSAIDISDPIFQTLETLIQQGYLRAEDLQVT